MSGTTTHPNPFQALALLFKALADALETAKAAGQPPRWVRIARVREFCKPVAPEDAAIGGAVATAAGFLVTGIATIQKFTLKAWDILEQADSATALFEVSAETLKKIGDPDFYNAMADVIGQPHQANSPLATVGSVIGEIEKIVNHVPTPEDLQVIGLQIYRMLVIEQLSNVVPSQTTDTHVDIAKTGKLRLVQWSLSKEFEPLELAGTNSARKLQTFGARRLIAGAVADSPRKSTGIYTASPGHQEKVFEFGFAGTGAASDLDDVKGILTELKYYTTAPAAGSAFDDELTKKLRQFQKINLLPITGLLDNATLNQMLNLDYDPDPSKGGLKKAKAWNANDLVGFDDTKNS